MRRKAAFKLMWIFVALVPSVFFLVGRKEWLTAEFIIAGIWSIGCAIGLVYDSFRSIAVRVIVGLILAVGLFLVNAIVGLFIGCLNAFH